MLEFNTWSGTLLRVYGLVWGSKVTFKFSTRSIWRFSISFIEGQTTGVLAKPADMVARDGKGVFILHYSSLAILMTLHCLRLIFVTVADTS